MDVVEKSLASPLNKATGPVDAHRISLWSGSAPRAKPHRNKCSSFAQRHVAASVRLVVRIASRVQQL